MQMPLFRAGEIMDMAIRIEHHGITFYQACLQSAIASEIEDVFNLLIDQEHNHVRIFTEMKKGVANDDLPEDYPGEMQNYINSFVKKEVFDSPAEASRKAAQLKSPLAAVDFAIDFEKRSIRFYSEIKPRVRRSESEKLDQVIAEEHGHIRMLDDLRKKLTEQKMRG